MDLHHPGRCGSPTGPRKVSDLKFSGHPAMSRTRPIYLIKYAGRCTICGATLSPGAGYTERNKTGWTVFC